MTYLRNRPPCTRPPAGTSKEYLKALHKRKMMGKFFRNADPNYRRDGCTPPHQHKGVL